MKYPETKEELYKLGKDRFVEFCNANSMPIPRFIETPAADWYVAPCAYYRRTLREPAFVDLCIAKTKLPCSKTDSFREWSWPGSTIDQTAFGVMAHELGHHVDAEVMGPSHHREYNKGAIGPYYSDWSTFIMQSTGDEKCFSSYAKKANYEWFAEMFRLYVTNHALLRLICPKTWHQLAQIFKPVSSEDWLYDLGENVPTKVVTALRNKM